MNDKANKASYPSVYKAKSTLFIVFIRGIAAAALIIQTPYYLENGIDIEKISLITAQYLYVFVLIDIISSYVFDKISKHFSIFLAFALGGCSFLIMGYAHAPYFFSYILISTFFASACHAFISGAATALVLEEVDDKKNIKTHMARFSIAYFAASLVGYCIGLVSTQFLSYKQILYAAGLLVLVACPFTLVFLMKNKHKDDVIFSSKTIKKDMKYALLVLFGKKRCILTLCSLFISVAANTLGLYALYRLNVKTAITIVFLRYMLSNILGIIDSKIAIHMLPRTMLKISFIFSMFTILLVLVHIQIVHSHISKFVLLTLMIISSGASFYVLFPVSTYFQRKISHRLRSTIISYRTSFTMLTEASMLPLLGLLYSKNGNAIFMMLAFMLVIPVFVMQFQRIKPKDFDVKKAE